MIIHLMDFDKVERYKLLIKPGPYSSISWEVQDSLDQKIDGIISYELKSDSVSEEHQAVLKSEDGTLILAVVGISECKTIFKSDSNSSNGSDSQH